MAGKQQGDIDLDSGCTIQDLVVKIEKVSCLSCLSLYQELGWKVEQLYRGKADNSPITTAQYSKLITEKFTDSENDVSVTGQYLWK